MFDKLEDLRIRLDEILNELQEPDVANDQNRFRKLMKEQNDLTPIVEAYNEYKECKQAIEDSLEMLERTLTMKRTLSLRSVPVQAEMRLHFLRQRSTVCICIMQKARDGKSSW